MAKRWPNWRLIKSLRTYTVEELANLLGKHENTIRTWIKVGLTPIDDHKPLLFRGTDVISFIRAKKSKGRRRCGADEFYCLVCHQPQRPAEGLVEFIPLSVSKGNLRALCPVCGHLIHRCVDRQGLEKMSRFFEISTSPHRERLGDWLRAGENCDQTPRAKHERIQSAE